MSSDAHHQMMAVIFRTRAAIKASRKGAYLPESVQRDIETASAGLTGKELVDYLVKRIANAERAHVIRFPVPK